MEVNFSGKELQAFNQYAQERGISTAEAVRSLALHALPKLEAGDEVMRFVKARCVVEAGALVQNSALYEAYCGYALFPMAQRSFSIALKRAGFRQAPNRSEGRMVEGLRLRTG